MDKQRNFFHGFIFGFILMVVPIPRYFFWDDVMEYVEGLFRNIGFITLVICGIPLIINVLRNYNK